MKKTFRVPQTSPKQQTEATTGGAAVVPTSDAPERTPEQTAAWIAERTSKLSEALQQAIQKGDVVASIGTVKIGKDASPTKQEVSRDYLKLEAMSAAGMAAIHGGKIKPQTPKPDGKDERTPEQKQQGACDFHNYGYDLDVRAKVRADLLTALEGPEKAIANMVKALRAADNDDDTIRTIIAASPKFKGFSTLDAVVNAALASK